jgi:hemimethylated DNA binding protein
VLVDQSNTTTYVAEQNLEEESTPQPVQHPLVAQYFNCFEEGCYQTDFC